MADWSLDNASRLGIIAAAIGLCTAVLVNQLLILAPLAKASKAPRRAYRPGRTQLIPAVRPAWGWPEHAHPHMSRSVAQGVRAFLTDMPTHGVSVCTGHSLRRGGVRAQPIRPITACVPVLVSAGDVIIGVPSLHAEFTDRLIVHYTAPS